MRWSERQVQVLVYTFKEGALSAVAHDLKLRCTRVAIEARGKTIRASIDARALEVVGTRRDGRDAPSLLRGSDLRKIESNIRQDVLRCKRWPDIVFEGQAHGLGDGAVNLAGELALCGSRHPLSLRFRPEGEDWVGNVELRQTNFGIKPYSALMGTLKVQDRVEVVVSVPQDAVRDWMKEQGAAA